MKRALALLASLTIASSLPAAAQTSEGSRVGDANAAGRVEATLLEGRGPRGTGTITLDNDVPFARDGQDDGMIGNRFAPGGTYSIASVSFRVAGNYISAGTQGSVVMSLWAPNTTAGDAQLLRRQVVTNAPGLPFGVAGTITDVTVVAPLTSAVTGNSGSFIGGIRNTFYDGCGGNTALNSTCDGVALTEGTSDPGSGFNAVRLLFTGPFSPAVTTVGTTGLAIANQNAIFRATGDNLPVELMQFEIE